MRRVEFLGCQELAGVVVDCVEEGDGFAALCGWEAELVVQRGLGGSPTRVPTLQG